MKELDRLLISDPVRWRPLPGPQSLAYYSKADELFYGGAAGGGKTDLILGLAGTQHYRSVIFRRVFPSVRAMIDRSREIYNPFGIAALKDSFNESLYRWRLEGGRQVRFGSLQYEKDVYAWQGQPNDLYGFDEITEFLQFQYKYVTTWKRTTRIGQRQRTVAAGNPPVNPEGRWVIAYWAPWLDETHPKPAKPGELRWYITTEKGEQVEVDSGDPVMIEGRPVSPKSRTFIPSSIYDNPYLMDTDYVSTLYSLPEPFRSAFLKGDFTAGMEDDPYQLLPTKWIVEAQKRWTQRKGQPNPAPIQQAGVDVARGGKDRTVITLRQGKRFHEQIVKPGVSTADGQAVATLVIQSVPNKHATIAIDAIGVGASPLDYLREYGLNVVPIVGSEGSDALDKTGFLHFKNIRSEIHWRFREALDPNGGDELEIPPDPELLSDLAAIKWKATAAGIQIVDKDDIKESIGRSPDKGESLIYAHAHIQLPGQNVFEYYKQLAEDKAKREQEEEEQRQRRKTSIGQGRE